MLRKILNYSGLGVVDKQIYKYVSWFKDKPGFNLPFANYTLISSRLYNDYVQELSTEIDNEILPASKIINWRPELDSENTVKSAVDHREDISRNKYAQAYKNKLIGDITANTGRTYWRLETMRQVRAVNPSTFSGTVLEIGAGSALISSQLSKLPEVKSVLSIDYDPYTVQNLMPLVQWATEADSSKITRVIGSYNKLDLNDGSVDTVVAVGAMHHSENLDDTFSEAYRVLKPGGLFVISDYALTPTLTQSEYSALIKRPVHSTDAQKMVAGVNDCQVPTNQSISEHPRPWFSYQSSAFNAGFNINNYIFDATKESGGLLRLISRYLKSNIRKSKMFITKNESRIHGYDNFGNVKAFDMNLPIMYPYYAQKKPSLLGMLMKPNAAGNPVYDNMVMILEKPSNDHSITDFIYPDGFSYQIRQKSG